MKIKFQYAISALLAFVLVAQSPLALASNLVAGVSAVTNVGEWSDYSAINIIAGPTLLGSSTKTVFYIAFTAGTHADISNMVLYKTTSRQNTILSVTPVTRLGISNPSIDLTNKTICKQAPSTATPCIVKLDALTLTLSPQDDYYFVIYFTTDSNNTALGGASTAFPTSSLTGFYLGGDQTQLKVGNAVPAGSPNAPYFLVAVQTS